MCSAELDDIPHLLQGCKALDPVRLRLILFTNKYVNENYLHQDVASVIQNCCNPASPSFCSFLLDCTSNPLVICLVQKYGRDPIYNSLFDITRTWIFVLHRERLKLRGQWKRGHNWKIFALWRRPTRTEPMKADPMKAVWLLEFKNLFMCCFLTV